MTVRMIAVMIGFGVSVFVLAFGWCRSSLVHKVTLTAVVALVSLSLLLATVGQWAEFRFFIPPADADSYIMGNTGAWALYGAMAVHILITTWIGALIGHFAFFLCRRFVKVQQAGRKQSHS